MPRRRWVNRGSRVVAFAVAAFVLTPVAWFWQTSLLPASYNVMDMGYADHGGGPSGGAAGHHHHHHGGRSVTSLTVDPRRPADVTATLTARKERFRLASGREYDGYTLNGRSPGPTIRATAGELVQVRLRNESVPDGVTVHWHGVDVANAADGVAGVTQDAVGIGEEFTYRFVADAAGSYWYHAHQVSHTQVAGGLFGALVVLPPAPLADTVADTVPDVDTVALVHLYGAARTVNGREREVRVRARPGERARVRVINTENGELSAWVAGAAYRLVAVDGTDLHRPTPVRDVAVRVAAGGRADLEVTMPADGSPVRVHLGGSSMVLGDGPQRAPEARRPARSLDPLSYGTPAPLGFDPRRADRSFRYDIGRRPGFLDGRPGLWWTINGHMFPDVPMFLVTEGDVVRFRISNHSGDSHPMHLHGHHAVVLSRDGVPATGSPWWVDSLEVGHGESYEIAFLADNPGIWMDHCHNLPHAAEGLMAHLAYHGVTTPFTVGGAPDNRPE